MEFGGLSGDQVESLESLAEVTVLSMLFAIRIDLDSKLSLPKLSRMENTGYCSF
jgi:hypothetical protein